MALTPCMSCLKQCGYLCGGLAALNIWFWIGMTIFNAMDNKWIKKEVLLLENYEADTSRYTTIFAICIGVSCSVLPIPQSSTFPRSDHSLQLFSSWTSSVASAVLGAPHRSAIRTRMRSSTIQEVHLIELASRRLVKSMAVMQVQKDLEVKNC